MSSLPPLPPRPGHGAHRQDSVKPPLPPLPPQLANQVARERESSLAAPRPRTYANPASDMANQLENQYGAGYPSSMPGGFRAPPPPPQMNYGQAGPGGFAPSSYPPQPYAPQAPPQQALWSPPPPAPPTGWNVPNPPPNPVTPSTAGWQPAVQPGWSSPQPTSPQAGQGGYGNLTQSMANMAFSPQPNPPQSQAQATPPSRRDPSPVRPGVVAALPTIASLTSAAPAISASSDLNAKVKWSKDVLALVDRIAPAAKSSKHHATGGTQLTDPDLIRLTETAIGHILGICRIALEGGQISMPVAEALYLRGNLSASGSFPTFLPRDPRLAFRDWDSAAKAGYKPAWFKLGRDYESVGDVPRAKECFEVGADRGETSCLYRLGMANLLGQLLLLKDPTKALHYLRRAADQADLDVPQPSYVFGMLYLGEFDQVDLPLPLIMSTLPQPSPSDPDPRSSEARRRIEKAAYLAFPPAQYKLGWAYEYAKMGCPFDPLLSVQYYSLASQQGETEADMALSKWFLCGSPGSFEKDEVLAVTFAEKAAKKGLHSAEFAMGYYCEVGIGGPIELEAARKWYQRAVSHGNPDAVQRLEALSQAQPEALSRAEHDKLTDVTLVRKRTAAKEYSIASGRGSGERRGTGNELNDAKRMAETARRQRAQQPLANDGLPAPTLPSSTNSSPRSEVRPLPLDPDGRRRYSSPSRARPAVAQQPVPSPFGSQPIQLGGPQPAPLGAGQQPLPKWYNGRFGKKDKEDQSGIGRGRPSGSVSPDSENRRPSGGRQRPSFGNKQSFGLSDSGPVAAGEPTALNPPLPLSSTPPRVASPSGRPKPETFAEMGFVSAPVKDKDCTIM